MTIRLVIADDTIKKHALLTLNVGDFNDDVFGKECRGDIAYVLRCVREKCTV